jgi:MFS transporter, OPA family, solute carrier family 37 (glycerol-3-phosphate transporter), member 1/2
VAEQKGYIAAMMDVGAIFGVLIIGLLTDKFNTNTLFLSPFLICSSIMMFITAFALEDEAWTYYVAIFIVGAFVSGPYKLIGTVITLDIGSQIQEKGSITKVSSLI